MLGGRVAGVNVVVACLVGNGCVRAVWEGGRLQARGDRGLARVCWIGCMSEWCVTCKREAGCACGVPWWLMVCVRLWRGVLKGHWEGFRGPDY